jgi:Prismane/CO dehydrogenase family
VAGRTVHAGLPVATGPPPGAPKQRRRSSPRYDCTASRWRRCWRCTGHYGGAWYKQKKEFDAFPGAILVTTNCVLEPLASYRQNIFTTGEVRSLARRTGLSPDLARSRPCFGHCVALLRDSDTVNVQGD